MDGLAATEATSAQGTCAVEAGSVRCALGTLPAGASATVAITARVGAGTAGRRLENAARVTAAEDEATPRDNQASAVTEPTPPAAAPGADLSVTKTAGSASVTRGGPVRFRVRVTNNGPATATGVILTDTLSRAADVTSVRIDRGSCRRSGRTLTCTIESLAPGQTATLDLVVRPDATGSLRNGAVATAQTPDPNLANNSARASVGVRAARTGLRLTKTASPRSVAAGRTVTFRIRVAGAGPAAARDVRVCDTLPSQLAWSSVNGAVVRGRRACFSIDTLRKDASRTFVVRARAKRLKAARTVRNVASASAEGATTRRAGAEVTVRRATARRPQFTG